MKLLRSTKILLGILSALLCSTVGTGVYYATLVGQKEILMPQLVGSTREDVDAWVQAIKLGQDQLEVSYAYDEDNEFDVVLSQSVPEGDPITKDTLVQLVLSQGQDPTLTCTLPDFTGKKQDEIAKWFENNKITHVTYVFSSDEKIAAEEFISSQPEAGTKITREDSITITISSGAKEEQKEITVPDFSTYTLSNMRAWGTTNHVTITVAEMESDTIGIGQFISQSVKAGTKVKTGSSITITLSSGKAILIENMVGKTRKEAEAFASKNNVRTVFSESYSTSEEGIILAQSPDSGKITSSSVLNFTVSIGRVNVADYTGKSKDSFQSYINSLNSDKNGTAKIALSIQETESDQTAGTILSQSVSGTMDPGSSITIQVAIGKKVSITSKAGVSLDEFKKYLSDNGMSLGNVSYSYNDSISKGTLISNDTGTYPVGSTIHCTVSNGPYTFDYSPYISAGSSYSTLVSKSAEASKYGYTVDATYETSETYDKGIIVRACSVSGKAITCPVSSGKVVTVPYVVGNQKDVAVSTLQNAGFKVSVIDAGYDSNKKANEVVGQDHSGKQPYGSTISISVSKGPEPEKPTLTAPNINMTIFQGKTANEIENSIRRAYSDAGFTNFNFSIEKDETNNTDSIVSITPAPGTTHVDPDTTVTVVIKKGIQG